MTQLADVVPVPFSPVQGVLALNFAPGPPIPLRPHLRLVTGAEREVDGFATRLAQVVVEVMTGERGVHQLLRWTTAEVYDDVRRRSNALRYTTSAEGRRRRLRAHVRSVHVSLPAAEVAELSIHVRHGERSRAIAARIELIERRWRCTVLEFG